MQRQRFNIQASKPTDKFQQQQQNSFNSAQKLKIASKQSKYELWIACNELILCSKNWLIALHVFRTLSQHVQKSHR